jgi:hypothetical protein
MSNFTATRDGLTIPVNTVSTATQLHADLTIAAAAPDMLVDNRGGADCYMKAGAADVSTTVGTGIRIPAGSMGLYGKGNATHVAFKGDAATSVVVHLGEGL